MNVSMWENCALGNYTIAMAKSGYNVIAIIIFT
jgi:hypothetical protein